MKNYHFLARYRAHPSHPPPFPAPRRDPMRGPYKVEPAHSTPPRVLPPTPAPIPEESGAEQGEGTKKGRQGGGSREDRAASPP